MKLLTSTWIPGHPRTKGSLDIVNAGGVTKSGARRSPVLQDSAASRSWLLLTVGRVREDLRTRWPRGYLPSVEPVYARMTFWMPAYRAVTEREIAEQGIGAAIWDKAGDVDKLARNVLDALSVPENDSETARRKRAGVYVDDVQVQTLIVEKYAASEVTLTGAAIAIYELLPGELASARRHAVDWSRAGREGLM